MRSIWMPRRSHQTESRDKPYRALGLENGTPQLVRVGDVRQSSATSLVALAFTPLYEAVVIQYRVYGADSRAVYVRIQPSEPLNLHRQLACLPVDHADPNFKFETTNLRSTIVRFQAILDD